MLPVLVMAVCFLGAIAISAAPGQGHWTLESALKQLDNEARSFHSLTADMERTKVTVVVNDKSTESGKIFVRRDDKMRIEITTPDPRTILRSGNDIFVYTPENKTGGRIRSRQTSRTSRSVSAARIRHVRK